MNGVVRSLTNKERVNELKQLLLGKTIHINEKESFEVTDILLTSHTVVFKGDDADFEINKVKKVEINSKEQRIRISNNTNQFVIPLI